MGWADGLGQVLQSVLGGKASEADLHSAFDKVAGAVPHGDLSGALSHVFNSDQTPPFEQMVGRSLRAVVAGPEGGAPEPGDLQPGSFGRKCAGEPRRPRRAGRGAPRWQRLRRAGPAGLAPGDPGARRRRRGRSTRASSMRSSGFYAKNPQLVKAIGAGALALLMSRLSKGSR